VGVEGVKNEVRGEVRSRLIENPIPRHDAVQKLEWFLISAVVMILVIRTQLWLTNYPQLGGNGLHIAHLLWGGLFMMIAIWVALIYLNRRARSTLAVVGGIGFGFFIDELGKFITSNNDYFFKPAAALIYIIFIALFLFIREFSRRQRRNPRVALANAMEFMPLTVTGEFGRDEYRTVSGLLDAADATDPRVAQLRDYFQRTALSPSQPPSRINQLVDRVHGAITRLTKRPRFPVTITSIVIVWGVLSVFGMFQIVLVIGGDQEMTVNAADSTFVAVASSISTTISGVLVLIGAFRMRQGRRQVAYRYFRRALLVSIFVTRVFSFVETQFGAVFGLTFDILLYAAIGELAARDEQENGGPEAVNGKNEVDGKKEAQAGTPLVAGQGDDQ